MVLALVSYIHICSATLQHPCNIFVVDNLFVLLVQINVLEQYTEPLTHDSSNYNWCGPIWLLILMAYRCSLLLPERGVEGH